MADVNYLFWIYLPLAPSHNLFSVFAYACPDGGQGGGSVAGKEGGVTYSMFYGPSV